MATEDELKEFVRKLGESVDADYQTQKAAADLLEQERRTFLQSFRDTADRVILPVFSILRLDTESATIAVENESDYVGLTVRMRQNDSNSVAGRLRYRADLTRRQIIREEHIDRFPNRDRSVPAHPSELTPEQVGNFARSLLSDTKEALSRRP